MNGIDKYREIVVDAISQTANVDAETASDWMYNILISNRDIAIDHSFFARLASDILSYRSAEPNSIIEHVRSSVEDTVRQFAVDMVSEFKDNPRKGKRDSDDVLSQLEAMGFSFDAATDCDPPTDEYERDFRKSVSEEMDRLQNNAVEQIIRFSGSVLQKNPAEPHPEHGFDPRNAIYAEFILQYVGQALCLDDDMLEEAPTVLIAVFVKLFMDAIESGSRFDEYFFSHKPDNISEANRYAISVTTKYWRKQPLLITAFDLFASVAKEGLSPATVAPIVSLCAELARFVYESDNFMPRSPLMDKHLNSIYTILAQA